MLSKCIFSPIPSFPIRDEQPLLRSVVRTDALGAATRTDLPPGSITVRLRHPAFLAENHAIRITAKKPNHRTVRANRGVQIRGRVQLPGGGIAVGAVVVLRDTTGESDLTRTVVTDAKGMFRFAGLSEEFQLRLSARLQTPKGVKMRRRKATRRVSCWSRTSTPWSFPTGPGTGWSSATRTFSRTPASVCFS